jgi:hypothetical protein
MIFKKINLVFKELTVVNHKKIKSWFMKSEGQVLILLNSKLNYYVLLKQTGSINCYKV